MKTDFTIKPERRLCKVNGEYGYFHCWEHYMRPVEASLIRGGHGGGQISYVLGIVELENSIQEIVPSSIQFVDEKHQELHWMNEHEKKRKEKTDESSLDR